MECGRAASSFALTLNHLRRGPTAIDLFLKGKPQEVVDRGDVLRLAETFLAVPPTLRANGGII